jgi:hypothetical protein
MPMQLQEKRSPKPIIPSTTITVDLLETSLENVDGVEHRWKAKETGGFQEEPSMQVVETANTGTESVWCGAPTTIPAPATNIHLEVWAKVGSSFSLESVDNPSGAGRVQQEWWDNITGKNVVDLTSQAVYLDSPTGLDFRDDVNGLTSWKSNYGSRLRGRLVAPLTENYTFWIFSDDQAKLWVSASEHASVAVKIAGIRDNEWSSVGDWTKFPSQKSADIPLVAGHRYAFYVLHKNSTGGDNVGVKWTLPGEAEQDP